MCGAGRQGVGPGGDVAGADVGVVADRRVADVAQVRDLAALPYHACLDLDEAARVVRAAVGVGGPERLGPASAVVERVELHLVALLELRPGPAVLARLGAASSDEVLVYRLQEKRA